MNKVSRQQKVEDMVANAASRMANYLHYFYVFQCHSTWVNNGKTSNYNDSNFSSFQCQSPDEGSECENDIKVSGHIYYTCIYKQKIQILATIHVE